MNAELSRLPEGARQAMTSLLEGFAALEASGASAQESGVRREALERFRAHGFPDRRSEAWRYTDLIGALQGPLPPLVSTESGKREPLDGVLSQACAKLESESVARIVFIDGQFDASRSELDNLPQGIRLHAGSAPSMDARADADMLESLNLSLAQDGFELTCDAGVNCAGVIHLLFVAAQESPCSTHLRGRVRLGQGASLRLLESHVGTGHAPCLQTYLTDCVLEAQAHFEHVCIGENANSDVSLARLQAKLSQGARLSCAALLTGGRLTRREYAVDFDAPDANAQLSALSLAHAGELRDITARFAHRIHDCTSDTLVKNVLTQDARGVFQGLVRVEPNATKSVGRQVSKALLLGKGASMNAKPELEIFNDDVECAHGSAIGELDADALFYLRARGISLAEARRLLIVAFIADVFARIEDADIKATLEARARNWLEAIPAQ